MTRRALLSTLALNAASPDWQALLARSITHDEDNFQLLRSYVFEIFDLSRARTNYRETQSYEVNLVGPGMYFRKLKHNDLPLSPSDTRLEQSRLRTHLSQTATSDTNAPWRKERTLLETWLNTHKFEYKGRRTIDKRPALVIESKPPKDTSSVAFLTHARCRIALDEETGHWVEVICDIQKLTVYTLNQLLFGRLSLPYSPGLINRGEVPPASIISMRLQRLEDGLWVPRYYRNERSGFFSELTFSKFRKFTSESQLLTDPQ